MGSYIKILPLTIFFIKLIQFDYNLYVYFPLHFSFFMSWRFLLSVLSLSFRSSSPFACLPILCVGFAALLFTCLSFCRSATASFFLSIAVLYTVYPCCFVLFCYHILLVLPGYEYCITYSDIDVAFSQATEALQVNDDLILA